MTRALLTALPRLTESDPDPTLPTHTCGTAKCACQSARAAAQRLAGAADFLRLLADEERAAVVADRPVTHEA